MSTRSRSTRTALAGALALTLLAPVAAWAKPARVPPRPLVVDGSLRLEAPPGVTFTVPGYGRFTDTIEVSPGPDGALVLVNELGLDAYVEGLGEMPVDWPMEALKTQVVAARTYAWYSVDLQTFHRRGYDFDICATVDCQVYSGRAIVEAPEGHRWAQAVRETAGEVLAWEGEPILARFFASSGGQTRNNEHVFGNDAPEGPRPYLKSAPDPYDRVSPYHEWSFRVTRAEFDLLLSRGSTVSAAVPSVAARRVPSDGTEVDQIVFTRADGHTVKVSASKFRAFVSDVGPTWLPHRFPVRANNGSSLPDGLPTSRLDFEFSPTHVLIRGHGWGHGVGMSQWGTRGQAEAGIGYERILASYYNGLRPTRTAGAPERIRVGLTWTSSQLQISADGPYRVLANGREAMAAGTGAWSLTRGNGATFEAAGGSGLKWHAVGDAPDAAAAARRDAARGAERERDRGTDRDGEVQLRRDAPEEAPDAGLLARWWTTARGLAATPYGAALGIFTGER